jgi:hypothetical protein
LRDELQAIGEQDGTWLQTLIGFENGEPLYPSCETAAMALINNRQIYLVGKHCVM